MLVQTFFVALGVFAGIYVGAIPGLSVTMATSLLIAMTYSWSTDTALAVMMGVYVGGVYGGSRAAVLLNIPGAPSAVATTFDGYPLAKKGLAGQAIAISTLTSVVGGLVGTLFLRFASPLVSSVALSFSPRDYFLLTLMGLMLVGSLGGKSIWKGLFSAAAGLMLGIVGMDPISGLGRLTFGNVNLRGGISYIAVMIGLFGVGESLYQLLHRNRPIVRQQVDSIRPPRNKLMKLLPLSLGSGVLGTLVGALPGAGGEIAALLAYDTAKRVVRHPETPFGEGAYEGVVAPESANNAAVGGALIPMLTLGIPGDSVTAILIGALAIHGIRAGPMLMSESPDLFNNLVFLLLMANIFLLILGMMGIRLFAKMAEIPRNILLPMIIVVSVIGSYSINNLTIDIIWTLAFGIVGYFMKYYDVPVGPMVLGLILGPTIEVNFRRAILSSGGLFSMLGEVVTNPLSLVLLVIMVLMIVSQIASSRSKNRENASSEQRYDYVWHADPSEVHDEVKDSPAEYYTGETSDGSDPVYIAHDIYYYPELDVDGFQRENYDGEMEWVYRYTAEGYEDYIFSTLPVTGSELPTDMMHSAEEAYENAVLHITQPGTYVLEGEWHGQIWIDLGDTDDTFADESAKVTLILNGVDVTCTVAPALVFYSVYECDNTWESQTQWSADVDTSDAGARVVIADGTENNFSGTNIYRILKTKYKDDTETAQKKRLKIDGAFYSYVSMEIEGQELGDGVLNIDAGFEGLDTELHLTLNGGNVHIVSQDDGINVNEDGVSVVTINGGSLHIVGGAGSEGDGIDSNGFLVINSGVVISTANPAADSGLDSDKGSYINGGYVVATGSTMDWAESDSEQVTMNLQFSSMQSSDEAIIVTDLEGNVIFAYDPDKDETAGAYVRSYQGAVISCPQFQVGETYHVYVGGDVEGTEVNGLYDAATVTGFTDQAKLQSYTGTDVGMGRPGGMGGGMGGGMNPQFQGVTDNGDGTITITQEGASSILTMLQQRDPETTVTVEDILACDTYQALMELAGMGGQPDGQFPGGMEPGGRPEGMEPGQFPEGMEPGERPEGMDPGQRPGDAGQEETGPASTEFYMTDKVNAFSGVTDADDTAVQTGFTDVSQGSWYYEAVSFMAEQGLMTGTGVTTFSPDETTTRGMVATILYRLAGSPEEEDLSFADVAAGQWYSAGVSWAVVHGVMEGNGQTFGPEEVVTREQLVVLAYRYAQLQGYDVAAAENALADYPDGDTVSDWAAQAMAWAVDAGVLNGKDGNLLDPQGQLTRAEAAQIFTNLIQALQET